MRAPFDFIVRPVNNRRYDNVKQIGGIDLITSVSEEDHKSSNRFAEVVALPINYNGPVEEGDILLVHHNAFKYYNDVKGRQKSGRSYFKDDLFFIEPDQYFMYNKNGKWNAVGRYCFVSPVDSKKSFIVKNAKEEPLIGVMRYPNPTLVSMGVKPGDEISFTPDSEYEFLVEEEKMYRMSTNDITMIV